MQSATKRKGNSSTALLIGIIAGFTFLIALFVGMGISNDTLLPIVFGFAICSISISLLLFATKKKSLE